MRQSHTIVFELWLWSMKLTFVGLFEWAPYWRKESGYPFIRDFVLCPVLALMVITPSRLILGTETIFLLTWARSNRNIVAAGNQTRSFSRHQAAKWNSADWKSVCLWSNLGVHIAPVRTLGIVQTLCRPFQVFSWFPIHKPFSNSTFTVTWITEPTTDSW